jgi:photosystem II stability/assembly factor-like uncharacterized protein
MLDEPEPISLLDTEPVPGELLERAPTGPYAWQNVAIKGGVFVSGIIFSSAVPNLIFARTDVGGAYRYSIKSQRWFPLSDWVPQEASNLLGVESIALDPTRPERVYAAAGTYLTAGDGEILRSDDFGETWSRHAIRVPMGGNSNGRSMGERLAVDPHEPERLYFGSRTDGLWQSDDAGDSWSPNTALSARGDAGLGLSFVVPDGEAGTYVGVASLTGPTLFRSRDRGESFAAVPGAPNGMMPHHAAIAPDGLIYLAYNDGPGPQDIKHGAVWRLDPSDDTWTDVSPRDAGFGGVSVDASRAGTLMVSTIGLWSPDQVYRSIDRGRHWFEIGKQATFDAAGAAWLYFGSSNLSTTGWMGDLEIDPFNRSRVLYVTGQGIWWSDNVTDTDARLPADFVFRNEGLEETVALDLASPPSGPPLLSALGDVAGFRHDELNASPSRGMFENPRFGNTTSLDFAEEAPDMVVRVGTNDAGARGALSLDGGAHFEPFASEPAGNGAGTIAISSDGQALVWSPDRGAPAFSDDQGASWTPSAGVTAGARVSSDRVDAEVFYAVDKLGVYVSHDSGQSFELTPFALPRGARLRSVFGQAGHVWIACSTGIYRSTDAAATFTRLPSVDSALARGFGRAAPDAAYPASYLSGKVDAETGLFRSDDAGLTWTRISDEQHQFGSVGLLTGDQRQYGRVYLGTSGRGIVYGDPL